MVIILMEKSKIIKKLFLNSIKKCLKNVLLKKKVSIIQIN